MDLLFHRGGLCRRGWVGRWEVEARGPFIRGLGKVFWRLLLWCGLVSGGKMGEVVEATRLAESSRVEDW